MMESNFYSDEFEQLIREKTEQYKMYPSEKVWKGVHSSLHTKRKWFITSMFLLVTGILFLAGKELILPNHPASLRKIASTGGSPAIGSKTPEPSDENPSAATFSAFKSNTSSSVTTRHDEESDDPSSANESYKGLNITISDPVISQPDLSEYLSKAVSLPSAAPALPMDARMVAAAENNANGENRSVQDMTTPEDNAVSQENNKETGKEYTEANDGAGGSRAMRAAKHMTLTRTVDGPDIKDGPLKDPAGAAARNSPLNTLSEALDQQRSNWLQEDAFYNLPPSNQGGRKYWQIYLTPTLSSLDLSGGSEDFQKGQGPGVPASVFNSVSHYSAAGFEAGGSLLYRVTRNLTFKAGLQFNWSRFTMKAYSIDQRLNSAVGYEKDSTRIVTSGLRFNGEKAQTLSSEYYQVSAPIGFELRILGNERLQFHFGASVQPSYLLNTNAYRLTPDYANFIKDPSSYRRWNVYGGLEAFLSYKTKSVTWQVGPEFRYQFLSTYKGQNPPGPADNYGIAPLSQSVKTYGIKIGVTKAFR